MKLFGKGSPSRHMAIRFVVVFIIIECFTTYVQYRYADVIQRNEQIASTAQAGVDKWTTSIHTAIDEVQKSLDMYNAYYAAHTDDRSKDIVGTKNSLASNIYAYQFSCQHLIEDYNKQKPTWPSYVKAEDHSITECTGK